MVALCLVVKSPDPAACVFFSDSSPRDPDFEREVLNLVRLPGDAIPADMIQEGDSFYLVARGELRREIWTWIGYYRHALDSAGRTGGYASAGVLLRSETCRGSDAMGTVAALEHFLSDQILLSGRPPDNWRPKTLDQTVIEWWKWTQRHSRLSFQNDGLGTGQNRFRFLRGPNRTDEDNGHLLDQLQTDPSYQDFDRILFSPSASYEKRLIKRAGLDIYPPFEAAERQDTGQEAEPWPETIRQAPSTMPRETQATYWPQAAAARDDTAGLASGSSQQAVMRELAAIRALQERTLRSLRIHRRIAWLAIALIIAAAGGTSWYAFSTLRSAEFDLEKQIGQVLPAWQLGQKELSGAIVTLESTIAAQGGHRAAGTPADQEKCQPQNATHACGKKRGL